MGINEKVVDLNLMTILLSSERFLFYLRISVNVIFLSEIIIDLNRTINDFFAVIQANWNRS